MLYYWVKLFKEIYIFCPTYTKDTKWRIMDKYVRQGKITVWSNVTTSEIKKIWDKCDENTNKSVHFMIYFDDCAGQPDFKLDRETGIINQLVSKGNHSNISTAWVVQKVTQCSTIMRSNAEGLLTFYVQSEAEKKYIFNEFGCGTYKQFKEILEAATSAKYASFYVNRQGPGKPDYYKNFRLITTTSTPTFKQHTTKNGILSSDGNGSPNGPNTTNEVLPLHGELETSGESNSTDTDDQEGTL